MPVLGGSEITTTDCPSERKVKESTETMMNNAFAEAMAFQK